MAETEDNGVDSGGGGDGGGGGTIGEWRALISSPKGSLFSGFLADGYAKNDDFVMSSARKPDEENGFSGGGGGLDAMMDISSSNWKPQPSGSGRNGNGGGSIAERRAARCGFNAPRLNTARFRSTTSPLSSPSIRSPYLTIPPGLSPTSLLDSPVMLPNSQAQPSPTTGTFRMPSQCLEINLISETSNADKDNDAVVDSPFMFKPHGDLMPLQCLSGTENQVSNQSQNMELSETNRQIPSPMETQALPKQTMSSNHAVSSPSTVEGANNMIVDSTCISTQMSNTSVASEHALQHEEQVHVEDAGSQMRLESGDNRGIYPTATGRPSEDGYNWRKYGQKQVKGSEYPRSYYKCTHQNCQVKKKIERSHDGQITEIIYKGGHNHPQPQPSRRSGMGSAFPINDMLEIGEDTGSYVKVEGGSAWRSIPQGSKDNKVNSDWRGDGQERTSSASVVTEVSDPLSTAQGKHLGILESADTPELSSTLASHDEEDDRATQGSISLGDDADDDESESKRRKKDSCLIETNMASRAVREPRVVVQTDSEVDILDDGYRWRKYGQKVVKGNPNPRSYYKCTSAGCSVRKHVERASHDLKYVITTYEGKHNHEVPAARSSSHMNSNAGNIPPATSNSQAGLTLPRHTNIPKIETQGQDMVPHFDRKLSNEFFRPGNFGGFVNDMKFMPSAYYELKLPQLQTSIGTYGLNSGVHQAAHIPHIVPDFSMPMNVPLSADLGGLSGFGCNNLGKSYISGQQTKDGEMKFLTPKQEQRDDPLYESQQIPNASSASMYRQMMGGYPL